MVGGGHGLELRKASDRLKIGLGSARGRSGWAAGCGPRSMSGADFDHRPALSLSRMPSLEIAHGRPDDAQARTWWRRSASHSPCALRSTCFPALMFGSVADSADPVPIRLIGPGPPESDSQPKSPPEKVTAPPNHSSERPCSEGPFDGSNDLRPRFLAKIRTSDMEWRRSPSHVRPSLSEAPIRRALGLAIRQPACTGIL